MTIDIRPELEAKLAAHARAIGMPVQRFVEDVLEREARFCTNECPSPIIGQRKKPRRSVTGQAVFLLTCRFSLFRT